MINSLLTSTKIVELPEGTAKDLAQVCRFTCPTVKTIAVVIDKYSFPLRDLWIEELGKTYTVNIYDKVVPNPRAIDINEMVADLRKTHTDLVIAIGGGSTLDSAKALAMLAINGGNLDEYLGSNPSKKIEKKGLPLILLPTTAGTGSEVTKVGVFTSSSGRKYTLGSPFMQADVALLCAAFSAGMPPALTAATGFDALSHAFESIWNKNATAITIEAAIEAAKIILANIYQAYKDSSRTAENTEPTNAQVKMLKASCMAGVAFGITGTAAVHAISFILSEEWHVPHGTACAFTLDDLFRRNCKDKEIANRFEPLIKQFCGENANINDMLNIILDLKKKLNIPTKFKDIGVNLSKEKIPELFERSFEDPKMHNNMPPLTKEEVYEILEAKL